MRKYDVTTLAFNLKEPNLFVRCDNDRAIKCLSNRYLSGKRVEGNKRLFIYGGGHVTDDGLGRAEKDLGQRQHRLEVVL